MKLLNQFTFLHWLKVYTFYSFWTLVSIFILDSLEISLIQLKQNQDITIVKITGKRSFLSENNLWPNNNYLSYIHSLRVNGNHMLEMVIAFVAKRLLKYTLTLEVIQWGQKNIMIALVVW